MTSLNKHKKLLEWYCTAYSANKLATNLSNNNGWIAKLDKEDMKEFVFRGCGKVACSDRMGKR